MFLNIAILLCVVILIALYFYDLYRNKKDFKKIQQKIEFLNYDIESLKSQNKTKQQIIKTEPPKGRLIKEGGQVEPPKNTGYKKPRTKFKSYKK